MEIVKFIKQSKYPVSKAEMFNEFPGVSEIVINIALNDPDVINYFGSYLHSSNLKISAQESRFPVGCEKLYVMKLHFDTRNISEPVINSTFFLAFSFTKNL